MKAKKFTGGMFSFAYCCIYEERLENNQTGFSTVK